MGIKNKSMKQFKLFLLILAFFQCAVGISQITAPVRKINGVEYYMHTVEKGQTLYSIARMYSVGVESVKSENQIIDNVISVGQVLKIKKESSRNMTRPDEIIQVPDRSDQFEVKKPDYHIVEAGETFYSIARQYQMKPQDLIDMNPGYDDGLNVGDRISLNSKQVKREFIPRDSLTDTELNVVLMLPFYASVKDSLLSSRQKVIRQTALQIFRGMKMATDSLKKLNLTVNIRVIDFENNLERLETIMQGESFAKADVVIGPLFKESLLSVADWAEKNSAWVVCPVPITNKVLIDHPRLIKAYPSDVSLWASTARYLQQEKSKDSPVFLYQGKTEQEKKKAEAFQNAYVKNGGLNLTVSPDLDSLINLAADYPESCALIVPSGSSSVFAKVNKKGSIWSDKKIFGTQEWQDYIESEESENDKAISKISFIYPKSIDVDRPNDPILNRWTKSFQRRYYLQPAEYAFCGYDILVGLSNYYARGNSDFSAIPMNYRGISTNSDWLQVGSSNGYENIGLIILESNSGKVKRVE